MPNPSSATAPHRNPIRTARRYPYGKSSLGGFLRSRAPIRKAVDGTRLRASSIHIAFMVCEDPMVSPRAIMTVANAAMDAHSTRFARSSTACLSGGN